MLKGTSFRRRSTRSTEEQGLALGCGVRERPNGGAAARGVTPTPRCAVLFSSHDDEDEPVSSVRAASAGAPPSVRAAFAGAPPSIRAAFSAGAPSRPVRSLRLLPAPPPSIGATSAIRAASVGAPFTDCDELFQQHRSFMLVASKGAPTSASSTAFMATRHRPLMDGDALQPPDLIDFS